MIHKEIHAWSKRKGHQRLRWLGKEVAHILLTFAIGVVIATAYHLIVTNNQVITTAEKVCDAFGRDAEECRNGISDLLNMSDNEVQNNININGGEE